MTKGSIQGEANEGGGTPQPIGGMQPKGEEESDGRGNVGDEDKHI